MAFDALEVAIELCASLRLPLERLRQHDRDLCDQARRAANGVALQLAESRRRAGKDRLHLLRIAAGSADELRTALRLAQAWRDLEADSLAVSMALLDRVIAMLWRLTR
jgi:four helix bundle protein